MKILAVDTASKNCSVAIVEVIDTKFNIITQVNNDDEKTHSQKLMPMIAKIFEDNNLTLDNIDVLACCLGPGSFTGIRIGIATIKAFADAKNIPTIGVTSLESLAYNVYSDGYIASLIDCKNNNVYASLFSKSEDAYTQVTNNMAENIDDTLDIIFKNSTEYKNITFVGDGSLLYKDLINSKFSNYNINFCGNNVQIAISLAKCAYLKYLKGEFGDSNFISPLYLRKSQAERQLSE